ncbi:hypothetical protein B0A49_09935 [Cryomyces minteri]|uniref:Uncharacterized protein n=1 Tax=Cryomyces minteri TaxID=331657 RepID=A0A4V5NE09_9PEZI|nr:hypothetical protein B0A49_09935 [Cryomyces minteri]
MPGKEDTYHWALIVGPKDEKETSRGYRIHVKDTSLSSQEKVWVLEERESSMQATGQLLIRVLVAKITDRDRLLRSLRTVPIVKGDASWNCVSWVKEALGILREDGKAIGTSKLDWQTVRDTAMAYCQRKRNDHRFDGKARFDMSKAATYDLLEMKETIP